MKVCGHCLEFLEGSTNGFDVFVVHVGQVGLRVVLVAFVIGSVRRVDAVTQAHQRQIERPRNKNGNQRLHFGQK